jgi:hypothetical protein
MRFESRPAGKTVLTGDSEERIAALEAGGQDRRISGVKETGMELSEPLQYPSIAGCVALDQIFRLVFEVVEVGIAREAFYRHANFLSYAQVRSLRAEREFIDTSCDG